MTSRMERATRTLGCDRNDLTGTVSAFLGVARPRSPLAAQLAAGAFARLDAAPLGALRIGDLGHTAQDWPALPATAPVMPWQAVTLVDSLAALVNRLSGAELQDAAEGFALRRADFALPAEDLAPGEPPGTGGGAFVRQDAFLDALAATAPGRWSEAQRSLVRQALLQHLADLGDGLLRVSEHTPAPLRWEATGPSRTGRSPVPGTRHVLEARVTAEPARRPPGRWDEVMWGRTTGPVREQWRWEVGWPLSGGEFAAQEGTAEATLGAAVFAGEQTLAALLRGAAVVRQRFTGRLLVPRPAGAPLAAGDPALTIVTLRRLLLAVFNAARSGGRALWPPLPHTGPDGEPGSVIAVLFDHLALPYPAGGEAANAARPGTAVFAAFLAEHAVRLTPLATAYLTGASAAEGSLPLRARHEAGLTAALRPAGGEEADRLIADAGVLPDGMDWSDLLDPAALERFLDDPVPEQ
ncbi:hypothetical protein ACFVIM_27400 [Streptomyces sp. NPDC057638]|uniref:hypothetical protein n=1 Tax=Streptomyces sp. NPDC057638 TaxID=3346190 RepID=UPI003684046B